MGTRVLLIQPLKKQMVAIYSKRDVLAVLVGVAVL
jgi:hypothetical protein